MSINNQGNNDLVSQAVDVNHSPQTEPNPALVNGGLRLLSFVKHSTAEASGTAEAVRPVEVDEAAVECADATQRALAQSFFSTLLNALDDISVQACSYAIHQSKLNPTQSDGTLKIKHFQDFTNLVIINEYHKTANEAVQPELCLPKFFALLEAFLAPSEGYYSVCQLQVWRAVLSSVPTASTVSPEHRTETYAALLMLCRDVVCDKVEAVYTVDSQYNSRCMQAKEFEAIIPINAKILMIIVKFCLAGRADEKMAPKLLRLLTSVVDKHVAKQGHRSAKQNASTPVGGDEYVEPRQAWYIQPWYIWFYAAIGAYLGVVGAAAGVPVGVTFASAPVTVVLAYTLAAVVNALLLVGVVKLCQLVWRACVAGCSFCLQRPPAHGASNPGAAMQHITEDAPELEACGENDKRFGHK